MGVTNEYGKATQKQYSVIKSIGKWHLVADIHVVGDTAIHEFRIQRILNDIQIYPGATLDYALKRFEEVVKGHGEK